MRDGGGRSGVVQLVSGVGSEVALGLLVFLQGGSRIGGSSESPVADFQLALVTATIP